MATKADADGTTPLHMAVHNDDVSAVDRLIRSGADVNAKNDYGATPMSEAAITGNVAVMKHLLEAGADVESPNPDGQTALMIVARTSNVEAARLLLSHGANVNAVERWRGQTALMWSAAERQPLMVKELVAAGANVNARSTADEWERQVSGEPRAKYLPTGGFTPLLYAAREGCVECARILVEGGADVNLGNPDQVNPLLLATLNGQYDVASYLLAHGANPNRWDWWGRSPLYAAVDMNTIPHGGRPDRPSLDRTTSLQMIEQLLAAGANPNLQLKLLPPFRNVGADRGEDLMLTIGSTPLLRAAKAFDVPAMRLLLAKGALLDLATVNGTTPIMAAAGLGTKDIDTRGQFDTPDVQQRAVAAIELLLEAGADVNAPDVRGQTPIFGAIMWGWNDVVKYLAAHGARLDVKDARGMTVIDAALGRAGTIARGNSRVDVREDTAALLRSLAK